MAKKQEFNVLPLIKKDDVQFIKVPETLLMCPKLHSKYRPEVLGVYESWAIALHCQECDHKWYVCNRCNNTRARLYTLRQLKNHSTKQHKTNSCKESNGGKKRKLMADAQFQEWNENFDTELDDIASTNSTSQELSNIRENTKDEREGISDILKIAQNVLGSSYVMLYDIRQHEPLGFSNKRSEKFYQNCRLRYPGEAGNEAGMAYLVLLSQIQRELQPHDFFERRKHLLRSHLMLQMQIAEICLSLPRTSQQNFVSVLGGSFSVGCEDGYHNAIANVNGIFNQLYSTSSFIESDAIQNRIAHPFDHCLIKERAHQHSAKIPRYVSELNKYYNQNRFSILENIPRPPVLTDIEGHAYVSIIDCIRDALGHPGARIASIPSPSKQPNRKGHDKFVEELIHCSKAKDLYNDLNKKYHRGGCEILPGSTLAETKKTQERFAEMHDIPLDSLEDVLYCYLIFWHDDADPQSSSMQGRANVWVKTVTIGQPLDDSNRVENTYTIACGEKGLSHDAVERKINLELEVLSKGIPFYVGALNKKVKVCFGVLATLADQPERRSANCLTGGGSIFHARTAVSADHNYLYEKGVLNSCRDCKIKLIECYKSNIPASNSLLNTWSCDKCLNWNVLQENNNQLALCPLPKGYPDPNLFEHLLPAGRIVISSDDGVKFLMQPFRITYDSLKAAVDIAHIGVVEHGWTKATCKAFLSSEGINENFFATIYLHANRALALRELQSEVHDELLEDSELHPEAYMKASYPAQWQRPCQELRDTIDALMHLMFLGIVNTTMEKAQDSLAAKDQNAAFIESSSKYPKSILAMTLDWLKLRPYSGGKFYGWNSENYQGFARLMPWFYQNYAEYPAQDQHKYAPPANKPPKNWTVKEHQYWLKIRNLDATGNKCDLITRVREYMNQEVVPQPIPRQFVTASQMEHVMVSLNEMLQCIMSRRVNEGLIQKTGYAIRIFLTAYDEMESILRETKIKKKKPSCISSYNFLCLLNLPEAMARYGPLRALWEGKIQGEGILRHVKSEMTQGMRKNWAANLMKNCLDTKQFKNITNEKENNVVVGPRSKDFLRQSSGMFHRYSSVMEVQHALLATNRDNKSTISVILVKEEHLVRIFAVVHDYETVLELSGPIYNGNKLKFGFTYYGFGVAGDGQLLTWPTQVLSSVSPNPPVVGFGLLLPLLDKDIGTEANRKFALISSNWKHLSSETELHHLIDA